MENRFVKLACLRSHKAFSLLELLLGLLIFSIVSASIYSVFWSGIRLDKRSKSQNRIFREARWTFMLMEKELGNSLLYDFSNSYPDTVSFVGETDRIAFLASNDGKMKVIKYYLQPASETNIFQVIIGNVYSKNVTVRNESSDSLKTSYLMREEISFSDFLNDNTDKENNKEIIASHIKSDGLRFYFGIADKEDSNNIDWDENWSFKYSPSHIKIEIDFLSEGKEEIVKTFTKKILIPSGFLGVHEK